jgi:hypothetical protein
MKSLPPFSTITLQHQGVDAQPGHVWFGRLFTASETGRESTLLEACGGSPIEVLRRLEAQWRGLAGQQQA